MAMDMTLDQAFFVADDIIKDILSLAGLVCNMPTHYPRGSGKLLKTATISNQINKKLTLLKKYLKHISYDTLSVPDADFAKKLLQSTDELSMLAYHLAHIANVSKAGSKLKAPLSFAAQKELGELWSRIDIILRTLEDAFLKSNSITSMWMIRQNVIIQEQIKDLKKNHIKRLRNGTCCIEAGIYFLELLDDYGQISIHCTTLFHEAFINEAFVTGTTAGSEL